MTQEYLDKELYSGMGGPRYGYPSSKPVEVKPKSDLYAFLPTGWGAGPAVIDNKRQQEIMGTETQEHEMGSYVESHDAGGGPQYFVRSQFFFLILTS